MIYIAAGFTGTTYALTTPRIGAFPIVGTVTASTSASGFDGDNANNELTWSYWKSTAFPATWQLSFTSTVVSYCGVASHNVGSLGGGIRVEEWNGSAWVVVVTEKFPTDDGPILFLFAQRTVDRMRLRVSGINPTIGVIWFGNVLELPQKCVWTGSAPFNEATRSVFTDNVSDGGHVLDRFSTRKASACQMKVNNLSETWAAANVPALQAHMESLPVFMADRPSLYPKSVVYGSMAEHLQSPRGQPVLGAARSLEFNITGHQP